MELTMSDQRAPLASACRPTLTSSRLIHACVKAEFSSNESPSQPGNLGRCQSTSHCVFNVGEALFSVEEDASKLPELATGPM